MFGILDPLIEKTVRSITTEVCSPPDPRDVALREMERQLQHHYGGYMDRLTPPPVVQPNISVYAPHYYGGGKETKKERKYRHKMEMEREKREAKKRKDLAKLLVKYLED